MNGPDPRAVHGYDWFKWFSVQERMAAYLKAFFMSAM
jgi:hypothetical protein